MWEEARGGKLPARMLNPPPFCLSYLSWSFVFLQHPRGRSPVSWGPPALPEGEPQGGFRPRGLIVVSWSSWCQPCPVRSGIGVTRSSMGKCRPAPWLQDVPGIPGRAGDPRGPHRETPPSCGPLLSAAPPTLGHMLVLRWPGLPHEVRAPRAPCGSARSPHLGGSSAVTHGPDLPATPPEGAEGQLAPPGAAELAAAGMFQRSRRPSETVT